MKSLLYLSIEGVDSVGKTTLVQNLHAALVDRGLQAAIKPEFPATSLIANEIEQALQRSIFIGEGFSSGPAAAFFFMLYAEMVAIAETPDARDVLVSDRGPDSACVYQGSSLHPCASFDANETLVAIESLYSSLGLRLPDCTLLLTLPSQELRRRFEHRNSRTPTSVEIEHLLSLQDRFLDVAGRRTRFVTLNADVNPEQLLQRALDIVQTHIKSKRTNDVT